MLSGIGPIEHLREKKIEPILHSPGVGRNLQDHVGLGGFTFLFESPPSTKPIGAGIVLPRLFTLNTYYAFTRNHTGPMYSLPFAEAMGFINTK